MTKITLPEKMTLDRLRYYIESGTRFRFAFFDPENPYRKNGLFLELEDSLGEIGEKYKKEFGSQFISINLRGSWLRGIPFKDDDIDILYIINDLPVDIQKKMVDHTAKTLIAKNELFQVCQGKMEQGRHVDPINFLDISRLDVIFNRFMFGSRTILRSSAVENRDIGQDDLFGSKAKEKLIRFLKSGILIPYVGWIYGMENKDQLCNSISRFLPIPTKKAGIYNEDEINITKEIIRETFVARNLIYPALNIKRFTTLEGSLISGLKEEALSLYSALAPLETIHARAVLNYLYLAKLEIDLTGKNFTKERIERFAPHYDRLVSYVFQNACRPDAI